MMPPQARPRMVDRPCSRPNGLRVILKKTKPLDQRSHARAQECARKAAHRSVYVRWVALGRAVMDLAVWLWSLGLERYEVVFREG